MGQLESSPLEARLALATLLIESVDEDVSMEQIIEDGYRVGFAAKVFVPKEYWTRVD